MAYIQPNSTIRIHKAVPLDNTYDHTLWFNTVASQNDYFSNANHIKQVLDNYSYQRHTEDSIRVAMSMDDLAPYTYMSFKNTSYENKWFYAFIVNMEYVNNTTTELYYEIDVIQTYMFDIRFHDCFVERQHTRTDVIGENTQPEPVNVGEYYITNAQAPTAVLTNGIPNQYLQENFSIVVAGTFSGSETAQYNWQDLDRQLDNEYLYLQYNRIINSNEKWDAGSSSLRCCIITANSLKNMLGGKTPKRIKIGVPNTSSMNIAFLSSISNIDNDNSTPAFCTTTPHVLVPSANTNVEYAIPDDCQYVYILYVISGAAYIPSIFQAAYESSWTMDNYYGGLYGGCYSGVILKAFDATIAGAQECSDYLSNVSAVANLIDGLVGVFMIPKAFLSIINTGSQSAPNFSTDIIKYTNWTMGSGQNTYTPKNNKLYTAPYTLLHVVSSDGKSADFPFEFFTLSYATFRNEGLAMPVSEIRLVPTNYKGIAYNYNEQLTIENYPQCSFNTDSYKAWLAMNATKNNIAISRSILNGISGIVGGVGGVVSGNASAIMGGVRNVSNSALDVASVLNEIKLASTMPPHAEGQNTNTLNVTTNQFGFHFYYCRPKDEYVYVIDDYFTRYGYAINRIKNLSITNLMNRSRFTYTKTMDCCIDGDLPNEYSMKFVNIMNNGITFWSDYANVGNYSLANTPLG